MMSRKAFVLCASAIAVLLICGSRVWQQVEQVRFVVWLQERCLFRTAVISTEGGIGGFFIGDANGLQGQLPPGKYSAITQSGIPSASQMVEFQ